MLAHTARFAQSLWRPLSSPTTHATHSKIACSLPIHPGARDDFTGIDCASKYRKQMPPVAFKARSSTGSDGEEKFPLSAGDRNEASSVPEVNREATAPSVGDRPVLLTTHLQTWSVDHL
jgi:hypothetical protein